MVQVLSPALISDSVFEWRAYPVMFAVAVFLALLPAVIVWPLMIWLCYRSWERVPALRSGLAFWERAYRESPLKTRTQTRYAENLMLEVERRLKAGADFDSPEIRRLMSEAFRMQELIVSGQKEDPK